MSNYQTISDLMGGDEPSDEQDKLQTKFTQKQKEIQIKEIERAIKKKAASLGLPYVNFFGFPISPEALALIKEDEARRLSCVCFFYDGKTIKIAATDHENQEVKDLLERLAKELFCQGTLYLISQHSLDYAFDMYKTIPKVREFVRGVKITEEDLNKYTEKFSSFRDLEAQISQAQITDIVTMILAAAIKSNSSDIHIEGEEKEIKVRFRIDGVLHDAAVLEKKVWEKIIARIKLLAEVKINVTDKPQDGRFSIFTKKERVDIRASFLPTAFGESVVMRLLRSAAVSLAFEDLGLRDRVFEQLKREIERPNGMIITTGPTGSGKTTTIYAILKKLHNPQTKIITIEDPIEYQIEGVNQSQTSEKYTFAQGLKHIVRQDPDVIMVGEIRDLETAEIAIQAALTGHLVLSTIHTNDAAGTIPRFLSMGAKPYLLAPSLNAMIGQRLVRRLCQECKKQAKLDEPTLARTKEVLEKLPEAEKKNINFDKLTFFEADGCEACQGLGYKGRIGIYEIMTMNAELEKMILAGQVSEYDIKDNAVKNSMISMVQDGILKALEGITSVVEVFRVAE